MTNDMNQDVIINNIAHKTGKSRKEVIQALKQMSADPTIQKELKNMRK